MLQAQNILHDRYQLQAKLGQTAGRQTWLAEDLATVPHQSVIVKLLAFADQVNWETLKLFEREANILRQLDHPMIPKYRNYFSIDDRVLWFGLVQDYIPGNSLKDLLAQSKRFSEAQVREIATEILAILIYLHELSPPVLHRDLKPSNLILGEDQRVHVIDFGAVQDRAAVEGATFTVVGTYGYAPMEQFGGRTIPASDLYSLGATLIHLLTGIAPADLPQRQLRIQFNHVVSISPALVQWIETLTDPDAQQRFQTARQALTALTTRQPERSVTSRQSHHPTRSPQTMIVFERPMYSQVELQASHAELVVKIPGDSRAIYGAFAGIGLTGLGTLLSIASHFPVFPLVIFGVVLLIASINASAATLAILTHQKFTLMKEIQLPFYSSVNYLGNCSLTAIQAIIHHDLQFHEGKSTVTRRVVTIQTIDDDISFAKGLSRDECAWIVQEMNRWLDSQRS
ncbi:serine/threonine protein kinase [Pantanalinema sp. GBBB05]|uniref:serine/threonine protein kinase n=1 Tax=Pantanalinema sp. GBBB05 TaxID=2604139 RepID=UPI001DC424E2|nr:serine/threonine protein kinase [Pantanalinema sp. GBBB05]